MFRIVMAFIIFFGVFLLLDIYTFQLVRAAFSDSSLSAKRWAYGIFWVVNLLTYLSILFFRMIEKGNMPLALRSFLMLWVFIYATTKIILVLFAVSDDIRRGFGWLYNRFITGQNADSIDQNAKNMMSRSAFLSKIALGATAIPAAGFLYGMISGAHNYQLKRIRINFKNLPNNFNGLKIIHISDIHSGSFFNKKAVERGIEMIMNQKADIILFTGDLVNNISTEIEPYMSLFGRLNAPMGVFSVLGNHDYGDYAAWNTADDKKQNLKKLIENQKNMGWQVLMDQHKVLEKDGQQIGLLGIQNWGAKARFPKYGDLKKAHTGTENLPFKILMSHDPSHWDAQVRPEFADIDLMLSGHTHGMQFGINTSWLKWSPVQYMYKQWAGLYQNSNQYLHVNPGFGYIGYPGRLGILPEITVIELYNS